MGSAEIAPLLLTGCTMFEGSGDSTSSWSSGDSNAALDSLAASWNKIDIMNKLVIACVFEEKLKCQICEIIWKSPNGWDCLFKRKSLSVKDKELNRNKYYFHFQKIKNIIFLGPIELVLVSPQHQFIKTNLINWNHNSTLGCVVIPDTGTVIHVCAPLTGPESTERTDGAPWPTNNGPETRSPLPMMITTITSQSGLCRLNALLLGRWKLIVYLMLYEK